MTRDINDTLNALNDLLDEERAALLEGNLETIARIVEQKESLIEELAQYDASDRDALSLLDEKFRRNQALLDSALEGIRRVARRLASLRRVRRALDTYDEHGARQTIDMLPEGTVEKRA